MAGRQDRPEGTDWESLNRRRFLRQAGFTGLGLMGFPLLSRETAEAQQGQVWRDWQSLGGILTSPPDAVSWGPKRVDVVALGLDKACWHNSSAEGINWSGWGSLGGSFTSPPSVVSWEPGRLDIFALAPPNNACWHNWYNSQGWGYWHSLGGSFTSPPSVASWGPNRLDIFALGTDQACWHNWWDNGNWGDWISLQGILTSPPHAISAEPNSLDVVGLGLDKGCWHQNWDGSNWSGWRPLGGSLVDRPTVTASSPGQLDLIALGSDSAIWHRQEFVPVAPRIISFAQAPEDIPEGSTSTLSWAVDPGSGNASVSLHWNETFSPFAEQHSDGLPLSGSIVVKPSATTPYKLRASNEGGEVEATTVVKVHRLPAPPTLPPPGGISGAFWFDTYGSLPFNITVVFVGKATQAVVGALGAASFQQTVTKTITPGGPAFVGFQVNGLVAGTWSVTAIPDAIAAPGACTTNVPNPGIIRISVVYGTLPCG
jgi:hypothetical protein